MELSKAAQQEALGFGMASFDAVTSDQSEEIKNWRAVFEASWIYGSNSTICNDVYFIIGLLHIF